jgi:hypothetical protein
MIHGAVSYIPWKTQTPTVLACCSSVLFVPGLEASRLAIDDKRIFGTSTSQLWEPITNAQVQNLYLNSQGDSIGKNIHATGIVSTAIGIEPIYQKFIDAMNGLVKEGTIANWLPYPYDWRLPIAKAATGMIGTSTVVQTIEQMASTSKTGKVTIVAHSNGGLVTKMIYDALRAKGEAGLVDKILFVAVPEIGTPQALPGLLHGDNQEIANGYILSASVARGLGINMSSAYSLLPDQNYFNIVPQAIIDFASSTMAGMDFSKYFPTIASYAKMKSFIADASHGSLSDPTNIPVQGNAALFPQAESVHSVLDAWKPASSTALVAIAGWGLPTDVAMTYYQKIVCAVKTFLIKTCSNELQVSKDMSHVGDGVVTATSSLYSSSTKQVFNIGAYDADTGQKIVHADILQADPVITAIKTDIGAASTSTGIPYITSTIPDYKFPDDIIIAVHSPADINIYDKAGNHTGPIPNPIPGSDLDAYENNIPGSMYEETGDGVQVILPYKPDYTVDLDGTGIGGVTVTTDVVKASDGTPVSSASFEGMVVTPLTHMELVSGTGTAETTTYKTIKIDEDGDGIFDATATPDSMPDITPQMYQSSLTGCIKAIKLPPPDEKNMLDRFNKAWNILNDDKSDRGDKAWNNLMQKRITHIIRTKITDQNRTEMRAMMEGLLNDAGV